MIKSVVRLILIMWFLLISGFILVPSYRMLNLIIGKDNCCNLNFHSPMRGSSIAQRWQPLPPS